MNSPERDQREQNGTLSSRQERLAALLAAGRSGAAAYREARVGTTTLHRWLKSDDFRRAMLRKMMAYALGRSLTLADIAAADGLVPALRAREDRLPALIELIAGSEAFRTK